MHVNVYLGMFSLTRTIHMREMWTWFFHTPFCLFLMSAASDYEYRHSHGKCRFAGESGRGRRILVDTDLELGLRFHP
jgi:hypothetical protein